MAKRSIKEIRREELLSAAIASIGEDGLARTTMSSIAARAGMSTALVNHYFHSKDELLAMAMRRLSRLFRQDVLASMPAAPTPAQRLRAIIEGSFSTGNFTRPRREAWMQFMQIALNDPAILRIYHVAGARFVSNIRFAVRPLVPADQVEDMADAIAAIIDGFFWQISIERDEGDQERARRICWACACRLIPALADAAE